MPFSIDLSFIHSSQPKPAQHIAGIYHPSLQSENLVLRIPKILLLVKQIRPRTAQINNLRTPIPIFLQARTFKTVESVGNSFAAAHDAFVLVVAERAFVADAGEGCGAHVGVADGTFAVAFVAETAEGDAGGFAAHY